ncbi:hypothetical protein [Streptococcus sp. sy004]|uniref:hypothetical protein n=1 Tax=Streptococcus sp. sy004 TaxID=2600149 RepID=UPI0011B61F11|nr:hypothetical protein [Streptococcus sp. sy004]TWT10493.1 hypothetical protein FRX54_04990 [Streptococcus sp. sy004]
MIKKTLLLIVTISLLYGLTKLYIAYNLSHYAGYYVQQLPRKKGTNPELAILVDYVHYIKDPDQKDLSFDLDGNGSIYKLLKENVQLGLSDGIEDDIISYYTLRRFNYDNDLNSVERFWFDKQGRFTYYEYTSEAKSFQSKDVEYRDKASQLLSEVIPPVLAVQPKPLINLQTLFNQKHEARFND